MAGRVVPTIKFFEETHQYLIDDVEYPSVSTVLNFFMDHSRVPKSVLEFKRQVGRATHKAIELMERGELDESTVDDAIVPYLESWVRFKAAKPLRVIASEQIVYHPKHRYAGRLDFNIEFLDKPGEYWQIDAKCVYAMVPATALQTAGYSEAWNETNDPKLTRRAGLQLKADGSMAELYPYKDKSDFNVFLNCLNAYRWRANHA